MKAIINGIEVEGTPKEIRYFIYPKRKNVSKKKIKVESKAEYEARLKYQREYGKKYREANYKRTPEYPDKQYADMSVEEANLAYSRKNK